MMRRADRLFDIVQSLRAAARPMTAAALADHLEVTVRGRQGHAAILSRGSMHWRPQPAIS
jgi:hypothetical protein